MPILPWLRRSTGPLVLALACTGCSAGFSARTVAMRRALDDGSPRRALDAVNRELRVKSGDDLPERLADDDALLVLDRATIHHSLGELVNAKRDYETADKALDVLDLSHGTADEVGKWVYSDASGRYVAPPHEKLLVNVLDMAAYLETRDLSGARVEARRLAVTAKYLKDRGRLEAAADASPAFAFGALLAGFTFERSGDAEEAQRWYDDAARAAHLQFARIDAAPDVPSSEDDAEVLLLVGWGRVPHRIAERVPIGMALTRAANDIAPHDRERAAKLAAEGAVTWVSYPTLAPVKAPREAPKATIDGAPMPIAPSLDVTQVVEAEWRTIEGRVMAAAISRAVARYLAGKAAEGLAETSKDKNVRAAGLVLSLVLQVALLAADTPDTRSWETLPARLSVVRARVPPGRHVVSFASRGFRREAVVDLAPGGFDVVSFIALR